MLLRTHTHDNSKFTMNLSMIETVGGGGGVTTEEISGGGGHEGRSGGGGGMWG